MLDLIIAYSIVLLVCVITFRKWYYSQWLEDIQGRIVLITGCDSGFGYQLALRLESIGVKVFAACYNPSNAEQLFKDYPRIKGVHMDVTKSDSVQNAYHSVKNQLEEGESLWGLVNNAGIVMLCPVEFTTSEEFKNIFDVNVFGLAEVTRTFLPLLKRSRGRIVNMSSVTGRFAVQDMGAYVSSKHAVEGYSDVLRHEMKKWGVAVSILEPIFYNTGLMSDDIGKNTIEQLFQKIDSSEKELKESYSGPNFNKKELLSQSYSKGSSKTHLIIEAYEHALFAAHPKKRYSMKPITKFLLFLTHFPECILDSRSKRLLFPHPNYNYYKNGS